MNRLPAALAPAIAATVVAAGCAGAAPAGHARNLPRMPGLRHGKYQSVAIAFPGRGTGIASIAGYAGRSRALRSWVVRTAGGGATWTASRPASGQRQPGAQAGLAFVSARQGWAYAPGLFFTRDAGATWRPARAGFPLVGPVAVAGTSTWVVGYACRRGFCPATVYAAGRVGGVLRRLAAQPAAAAAVVAMQRPTTAVAWLLLAGRHGRLRLVTTSDAGRSWAARRLPCPGRGGQLSAAGPASLWFVCHGTPQGPGRVPGVLYRTTDGGRTWTRIAREHSLLVYAVGSRLAWAVQATPSGSDILRTTDGGRSWRTVLAPENADLTAFAPHGADSALAVARVVSANGWRFLAYRTRSGGKTWHHVALPT